MKFTIIDVNTNTFIGPIKDGIISKGSMIRLTQNTPSGGIHAVLSILATVSVGCEDKYSIQPLQNIASAKLIKGITMHPKRVKRKWDRVGNSITRPKLHRVRITP
jgi:hypothetical protein